MLGYVTAERAELRMREYDIYRGYYCGICKSIGRRLGQMPRLVLSYDSVFLAMLLGSLTEEKETLDWEHCIVHPVKKVPVCKGVQKAAAVDTEAAAVDTEADAVDTEAPARGGAPTPAKGYNQVAGPMDYAADLMVILAYYNVLDDWQDERSAKSFAQKTGLTPAFKKLLREHPEYQTLCESISSVLAELSSLEREKCKSIDRVGEKFAIIMECIFTAYGEVSQKAQLGEIGKHLGKWIYLIDAVDDLAEDMKGGSYNPLIYRFEYDGGSAEEFWERIREQVELNLFQYLSQISDAYDLLDIRKNKDIIENIIFFGLRTRTEAILRKGVAPKERGTRGKSVDSARESHHEEDRD